MQAASCIACASRAAPLRQYAKGEVDNSLIEVGAQHGQYCIRSWRLKKSDGYPWLILRKIGPKKQLYFLDNSWRRSGLGVFARWGWPLQGGDCEDCQYCGGDSDEAEEYCQGREDDNVEHDEPV